MKKYLSILAVLFTVLLMSCSNEEIPTKNLTTIKVNPATIMSKFTYQINPGDLDGVGSDSKLRIRLYIYDGNGNLFVTQEKKIENYLTTASFEMFLDEGIGVYKAVVITDVISNKPGSVAEYWKVTETEKLSSIRVTYIGSDFNYGSQEILGISSTIVYSGSDKTIDVEPAGALICTHIENIHAYSDIHYILLFGNRGNGYYNFSPYGELGSNPNLRATPYFGFFKVDDLGSGVYTYKFLMPQTNYTLSLGLMDAKSEPIFAQEYPGLTIDKGREYCYHLIFDPDDDNSGNISLSFDEVTGKVYDSSLSAVSKIGALHSNLQSCGSLELQKSWKVEELL